jgi:hypothetical protein
MASTYTGLGIEKMTTGENAGDWGTKTNTNLQIVEQLAGGYIEKSIAGSAQTTTLSVSDGSVDAELAHRILKFTGTITGNQVVTIPLDVQQLYVLVNGTSGAYTVQFKYVSGSGSSLTFAATDKGTKIVYATADDGTDPNMVDTGISTNTLTGVTGDITIDSPADLVLDAAGGNVEFKDAGTTQLLLDMDTTSGVQIIQLKVNSDDLVFQQYDGNEVVRISDDRRLYFYDKGGEYIYGDGTDLHITSGADINIPSSIGLTFGNDGEKIEGDGTDLTIAGNNINLTAVADVVIPANVGITFGSGEKIEGDSTDLTITSGAKINLTATSDIVVPADVGITFGTGEKIEGDSTDLTITSGAKINLTATSDVVIPADVGITFGSGEKIEGDSTDLTITSGAKINLTATSDIVVPADVGITFGTGEKIEGDSTNLTITSGADIALTATADINVPSGVGMTFGDDGEKIEGDGTDLTILSSGVLNLAAGGTTNQVKVTDGTITPLTDNDIDLGTSSLEFKNVYVDGTTYTDAIGFGTVAMELPVADGSANQVLKTDGSGNLDWTTISGTITALNNQAANRLTTIGSTTTELDGEANLTFTGSALTCIGTITVGADDAGHDVKYFGDTASAYILWDTSADKLLTAGGAVIDIVKDKLLIGGTAVTTTAAELNILDTVTSTATELNLMDGGTTAGTTAVASGDGIVTNDGGTMRQTTTATFDTYLSGSTQTLTNKTLTAPKFADAGYIADASGNELVILQTTGSAVNQFDVANAATGNDPTITATGGDSHVGLGLVAKGTGVIQITSSMNPTITSTGKALVMGF